MRIQPLKTASPQIVFQEVPDHIALAFSVSGCPLKCDGCHSQDTWSLDSGCELDNHEFSALLQQYQGMISCVLFLGGEWQPDQLIDKLKMAQKAGLKTCLYSGFVQLPKRLTQHLDFLKTGPWIPELGGLDSPKTNQRFMDVNKQVCLNHKFQN